MGESVLQQPTSVSHRSQAGGAENLLTGQVLPQPPVRVCTLHDTTNAAVVVSRLLACDEPSDLLIRVHQVNHGIARSCREK